MKTSLIFLMPVLLFSINSFCQTTEHCPSTLLTTAYFDGLKNKDTLTLEQFKKIRKVLCIVSALQVKQFDLKVEPDKQEWDGFNGLIVRITGDSLDTRYLQLLNQLYRAAHIYLHCVYVANKEGKVFILKDTEYYINAPKNSSWSN